MNSRQGRTVALMSRTHPARRVAVAFLAAVAIALLAGSTTLAAKVVATTGSPGTWHVIDSSMRNGSTCRYGDQDRLTSIGVRGTRIFADAHNSGGEWVGWQVIVQRTRTAGGGGWVNAHVGKVHEGWATAVRPAVFGSRTWDLPQPMNRTFRVAERLYWYHFADTDPKPIEASVTLRLEHYDWVNAGTEHPNHPSCPGYFV